MDCLFTGISFKVCCLLGVFRSSASLGPISLKNLLNRFEISNGSLIVVAPCLIESIFFDLFALEPILSFMNCQIFLLLFLKLFILFFSKFILQNLMILHNLLDNFFNYFLAHH